MKSIYTHEYQFMLEWLTKQRQLAGISQQQLAERLGKPQSYVSKFENGERRLDLIELIEICQAINSNPIELVTLIIDRRT